MTETSATARVVTELCQVCACFLVVPEKSRELCCKASHAIVAFRTVECRVEKFCAVCTFLDVLI